MPAILKGWMDRVFVYGRMYRSTMRYDTGICSGKKMIACVTTGASEGVMVGPMVLAGAAVVGLGAVPLGDRARGVSAALGRVLAAVVVLVAVVLAVEGIRQV